MDNWRDLSSLFGQGFAPLADVEETDDAFVVEVELAAVKKDDLNLELSGRRLVVTGERKERERVGILRKRTRTVGRFRCEVVPPADLDEDGVSAELAEGVLTVRVP
jgi:HSP20 family protein